MNKQSHKVEECSDGDFTVMDSISYQNSQYIIVFICSKSLQILRLLRLFILSHKAVHM
jgi:hypothetical protein